MGEMRKYLELARLSISQYLVYRLSFILWRFRVILSLFLIYFLWSSVYTNRLEVFSYTQSEMMTYVLLIYLVGDLVFSSRTADLASQIRNGEVINYLLKPLSFFKMMLTREMVDKGLNTTFSLLEVGLIIWLLKPPLVIHTDGLTLLFFLVSLILGALISFFISFSISLIAFWSTEVWAPRFVFFVLITVLAGSYFPLDVLPKLFYQVLLLTPFPYFAYLPTKIYLSGWSLSFLPLLLMAAGWTFISYWLAKFLWHKGIKEFSFFGR